MNANLIRFISIRYSVQHPSERLPQAYFHFVQQSTESGA